MQHDCRRRKKLPPRPVSLTLYEQGKTIHEIALELGISDKQARRKLRNETERYFSDVLDHMHYHKTMLAEMNEHFRQLGQTLVRMKETPPA
jgi:hypothetical protein